MVRFYSHEFHGRLQAFRELSQLQLPYREKFYLYADFPGTLDTSDAAAHETDSDLCAPSPAGIPRSPVNAARVVTGLCQKRRQHELLLSPF